MSPHRSDSTRASPQGWPARRSTLSGSGRAACKAGLRFASQLGLLFASLLTTQAAQGAAPGLPTPIIAADQPVAATDLETIGWPPRAQIQAALSSHPRVIEALARERVLRAGGDSLRAGAHETVLRTTQSRRRIDGPGGGPQHEWLIGIERSLRSGDKRQADFRLADQDVLLGAHLVEDARHETARELLRAWFAWQRAAGELKMARDQQALAAALSNSVERRVLAGDAAPLEAGLAGAELDRARAGVLLAQARESVAGLTLKRRFREIVVEAPDAVSTMAQTLAIPAAMDRDRLRDAYVTRSHELALARGEATRAQFAALRARAELRTDLSIGAFTAFDRGGAERIIGVSLSLPLAGPARDSALRGALAEHDAMAARADDLERKVRTEFDVIWTDATARAGAARAMSLAAAAQANGATRLGRAYSLGEAPLSDWLLARRSAVDAAQQALVARLDAIEANARLRLDLHELVAFDD